MNKSEVFLTLNIVLSLYPLILFGASNMNIFLMIDHIFYAQYFVDTCLYTVSCTCSSTPSQLTLDIGHDD